MKPKKAKRVEKRICPQCGRPYRSLACGPTHAAIKAEQYRQKSRKPCRP